MEVYTGDVQQLGACVSVVPSWIVHLRGIYLISLPSFTLLNGAESVNKLATGGLEVCVCVKTGLYQMMM